MKRFENQNAIVAGGAEGIGKGIAQRIASEGGRAILFDINECALEQTVREFKSSGLAVESHVVDISSEDSVQDAVARVKNKFEKIDVLVNTAGIVGPTSTKITDYTLEDFDKIYSINLKGAFLITKYVIQIMEHNNYGRILHLSSIAGKEGNPFMCGYSSMKAGMIGLIKGVGKEYAQSGITVNGLAPAVIRTAMNEHTTVEQLSYMTAKIPMGRIGTIEEVASIACWIVSKEASFNTGFIFDISGGRATY